MEANIFNKRRNNKLIFFGLIAMLTVGSIILTQYNVQKGFTSFFTAFKWGASNFYPNAKSMTKLPDILIKLKDTVLISIASTTVAGVFYYWL